MGTSSDFYINGISDSYLDQCFYRENKFYVGFCSTINRILHFDCLSTIIFQILIIFPVLFMIYGFGAQVKLREFYDKINHTFMKNLIVFAFGSAVCGIIHLYVKIPPPCIKWERFGLTDFKSYSRTPNNTIFIVTYAFILFMNIPIKRQWIFIIIMLAFCVIYITFSVLTGYTSIYQALITISLSFAINSFFSILPPIGIVITGACILLLSIPDFAVNLAHYGWIESLRTSEELLLRTMILMCASLFLYIRYGLSRVYFEWLKLPWLTHHASDDNDDAFIPSMTEYKDDTNFGMLLRGDLLFAVIAFAIYIVGNALLSLNGKYSFFD